MRRRRYFIPMDRSNVLESPRPYVQYRMCSRKRQYDTYDIALEVAFIACAKRRQLLHPYKCPYCYKFHVGHDKVRRRCMNIAEPKNRNYCGVVVALERFTDLSCCDNVKAAIIFGNQVIVGKATKPGDVGIFFPVETALSREFLGQNNLFRKPEWGNADESKKGYFEEHGRIKAVKFRGHKSEGFWIPIDSIAYTGVEELPPGTEFDQIGDHEICRKYVPKRNPLGARTHKQGRLARLEDRIVDGQFRFHVDTENLRRNVHKIYPDSHIDITDKWHGTSAVLSSVLVKRELPWRDRLAEFLGVNVLRETYGFTWASRRVVKGVGGVAKAGAEHYYTSDVWGDVAKEVRDLIPKGYTIYGEIVGFTKDGSPIQKDYHYGCQPGTHRFLVYRITVTNQDGMTLELSRRQIKTFCERYGLEMVKELYCGLAGEFYPHQEDMYGIDEWRQKFLECLEATYVNDGMCPYNNNEVPAEGIVLRIERMNECEVYKLKNYRFLERESKALDSGEQDMETQESEEMPDAA